jgi:hypothetical protein
MNPVVPGFVGTLMLENEALLSHWLINGLVFFRSLNARMLQIVNASLTFESDELTGECKHPCSHRRVSHLDTPGSFALGGSCIRCKTFLLGYCP